MAGNPTPPLLVIFRASVEVRNSIVFGTMIVVLVFLPLFALSGMEGRLFAPLGVAYIVSILASLLVSLTVTPVLSYFLLTGNRVWYGLAPLLGVAGALAASFWLEPDWAWPLRIAASAGVGLMLGGLLILADRLGGGEEKDGILLRSLKWTAGGVINASTHLAVPILTAAVAAVVLAGVVLASLDRDFLPPFNEGTVQLNVILTPGTSLKTNNGINQAVETRLKQIPAIIGFARRTGRAELDEHADTVNNSEFIIELDEQAPQSREQILEQIREAMTDIPGLTTSTEQPLAHLISHMLSGVKAEVGIKLYGEDLGVLRETAKRMEAALQGVPGVTDLQVEKQVEIPQLRIELDRDKLLLYGLTPMQVNDYIETAMNGKVVSEVLLGQRTFDLLVKFDEPYRENLQQLRRLVLELPGGGQAPLSAVAKIALGAGPNTINREQVRRRIVLQCNVAGRGLVDVVEDIQARLTPIVTKLPAGYFVQYGGQFESQQSAQQVIGVLFTLSMLGVFMVLYTMFRSTNFALQVMAALPMAFIGSVAALVLTGQSLTIAAMVGFISLGGIASRNGILLLDHYLHLVKHEGQSWDRGMLVKAGQDRLAPVLMTALTSGIGLIPLALSAGEPGKEILYPVATVIIGGLISSTLLEFLVRPALFWTFGMGAGARLIAADTAEVPLTLADDHSSTLTAAESTDPAV